MGGSQLRYDTVWLNACLATLAGGGFGTVKRGAVAARDGNLAGIVGIKLVAAADPVSLPGLVVTA